MELLACWKKTRINFWVGTPKMDYYITNVLTGAMDQYTTEDGLSSNTINWYIER